MRRGVLAAVLVLVFASLAAAADGMREGLWEIASQTEMPGMPMKMKPTVVKHCYTKQDVADRKNVIAPDKNCKVTDLRSTGNKVTWTMRCTGQNAGTMTGETVFAGDSYSSVVRSNFQGHAMTMKVKGKRLGDCKK